MTGAYERIAERLLKDMPRAAKKPKAVDGRLVQGTASMHRSAQARVWRTFWRIKLVRA